MKKILYKNSTNSMRVYQDGQGNIELWSYSTLVCFVDSFGWLGCSGLYSATTRRHISTFCRLFTNINYYAVKESVNNHLVNIRTGEVKELMVA